MTRTASVALKAHLAQPYQTMATCWYVARVDGTLLRFTDHDENITVPGTGYAAALAGVYVAATGYTASNVETTNALNVDNLEVQGILVSPSITEADLHAGLWDFAAITIFQVNWMDLTMGPLYERVGHLGQVTIERGAYKAELRGLTQAYTRTIGNLTSPSCRAILGDARCKVDLTPFTVTSTITGVNPDLLTLYDTARTEPGPSGGVAIIGVSNANPGVVTMANGSLNLTNSQPVSISGVVGPSLINQVTIAVNPSGATFQLSVDTSNTGIYPPYTSGGIVIPLGAEAGYFTFGTIRFTSGLNVGRSMEIKDYAPGQMTLALPLPYAVAIGDAYSMVAGCAKNLIPSCKNKFNNVVNFHGEPYMAGIDKLVQVARSG